MKVDPNTLDSDSNYHIEVEMPDGIKITILIPDNSSRRTKLQDGETVGLNLVTSGHFS